MLTDEELTHEIKQRLHDELEEMYPANRVIHVWEEIVPGELRDQRPPRARRHFPGFRPVFGLALTAVLVAGIVVGALALLGGRSEPVRPAGHERAELELVFRAEPTPQVPVINPTAIARTVQVMRSRIASLLPGTPSARVTSKGQLIFVRIPRGTGVSLRRLKSLLGTSARLEFYDWEANVLTPSGKPVASLLGQHDPNALRMSQGTTAAQPGSAAAGAMTLYNAVKLASKQTPATNAQCGKAQNCARAGAEYFAFGKSGSAACELAARHYGVTPIVGAPCYLAGGPNQTTLQQLGQSLPKGVSMSDATVLTVPQGWVVLQAVPPVLNFNRLPGWSATSPDFFVLRDRVALFGNDITNPKQSTDQTGQPNVSFGFTGQGGIKFQNVTAAIAKRGQLDSGLGQKLFQHFAVALDTQLLTVPYIDYTQNPFGIPGNNGAEIPGAFTTGSARTLAKELSLGALPVRLKLTSSKTIISSPTPATPRPTRVYAVPSAAMEPTLKVGQRIVVSLNPNYAPQVGDIIVFHPPSGAETGSPVCGNTNQGAGHPQACVRPTAKESTQTFIKRIVAGPGDTIRMIDGHIYRNGVRERDSYTYDCGGGPSCNFPSAITIPEGEYFMLGDNRGASDDSRFWGPVKREWIIGKAFGP